MKQFPTMLVTLTNDAKDDANEATVYKGDLKSWSEISDFLEQFAVEKPDVDYEEEGGGGASDGAN